jgi:hypothetical protein
MNSRVFSIKPACHAGGRGFESRPLRHCFSPPLTLPNGGSVYCPQTFSSIIFSLFSLGSNSVLSLNAKQSLD